MAGAAAAAIAAATVPAAADPADGARRTASPDAAVDPVVRGQYVVLMEAEPVVAYEGGEQGLPGTKPGKGKKVNPRSASVRKYVAHLRGQHREALRGARVSSGSVHTEYAYTVNGFAAELSEAEAARVRRQPGVVSVMQDELHQIQTDTSAQFLGLDAPAGPWARDYTGEGVVVAVIDTGVWPEHPSFADDGTFPEPTGPAADVPCEFGNTEHSEDDAPFECNNKLIGARDVRALYNSLISPETYASARDSDGHGTHTAGTAAGNSGVEAQVFGVSRGTVSGVAPRAHVLAYKACGDLGCFGGDLLAGIDAAVADGADVINYSIGGGAGPIGAVDLAFLFANDAGVFTATSAGNSGPRAQTVGSPAVWPWLTSVGASTHDRTFAGTVTLGNGDAYTGASLTAGTEELRIVDAAEAGNELCIAGTGFTEDVSGAIVLCKRGQVARVEKSQAVSQAGGAGMVLHDVSDAAALVTDNHWVPSVHVGSSAGEAIKQYIASAGEDATASIGGGEKVRAQGSVMAGFSSRGPNAVASDVIVPDVTAPGVNVLAGNTPTPALGAPGQLFQSISGTSMSSPHVAGVFALMKQANPRWSPAVAKSAVMTTARQDVLKEDGATRADPFDIGAGHVAPGGQAGKGSAFEPGLAYDAGFDDYLGFLCDADDSIFGDPAATCGALARAGVPTDASDLNLASIGVGELAGSQTVTRTVTSVASERAAITYTPVVQAPEGYSVSVSPERLTLRSGQSASYRVTISNTGAAAEGEWAFGSLTWQSAERGRGKDGRYRAYSPIAVRAVALDTPALVSGAGTSGALEVPVRFGYTGDYEARAHGVVPRTATPGNVVQDPSNGSFTPGEVGTTKHEVAVEDALLVRWRLVDDTPGADLDVFVYDESGTRVGASTNAGTHELVELPLPASGTYTVWVQGWAVPGNGIDYTLESWVVPAGTDGPLRVVDQPGDAVIATSGVVAASWDGLEAGVEHLGAVSHNRGDELLGLTLVEVTG